MIKTVLAILSIALMIAWIGKMSTYKTENEETFPIENVIYLEERQN